MNTYENPKNLAHMCNRLRSLGYVVKSSKWAFSVSAWQINLGTGQTLYFKEMGEVTLAPFQRDARLEYLFHIVQPPTERFARPLKSKL